MLNNWSKIQIVQNLGDTFPVLEPMINKLSNAGPCGGRNVLWANILRSKIPVTVYMFSSQIDSGNMADLI